MTDSTEKNAFGQKATPSEFEIGEGSEGEFLLTEPMIQLLGNNAIVPFHEKVQARGVELGLKKIEYEQVWAREGVVIKWKLS